MGRGPAVSQEAFTACASSPYPLRTPPGSSASIASKPAILAKIMHRRPAADLSDGAADPGVMHAVRCPGAAARAARATTAARRAPRHSIRSMHCLEKWDPVHSDRPPAAGA